MELTEYLAAIRKRWWLIAALALLGAVAGYVTAASQPEQYRATSKVYVSLQQGETVSELVQGSTYTAGQVQSYVQLATMPVVLDPVIDRLGLDTTARDLAASVSAEAPLDTFIIEISAVSTSPAQAQEIADAVVRELRSAVSAVSPQGPDDTESVLLTTVAEAPLPEQPFAPNTRLSAITGFGAGGLLGLLLALVVGVLDTKVSGSKDVARLTDAAVLGSIGTEPRRRRDKIVLRSDPRSPGAEAYRRLRTNLQFLAVEGRLQSIVVTSSVAGEGKSTTALNLALAAAEGSGRVLLVDADLRRPRVAELTGLEGAAGLSTVLIGKAEIDDVIQPWASPHLDILTSGEIPPNPSQLLASPAMAAVLESLVARYDLVIIDIAPLLPVADPAIVARLTDGALVVAGARRVHRHQLRGALDALESSGATCLGLVLNRVDDPEGASSYSYEDPPTRAGGPFGWVTRLGSRLGARHEARHEARHDGASTSASAPVSPGMSPGTSPAVSTGVPAAGAPVAGPGRAPGSDDVPAGRARRGSSVS